MRLKDVKSNVRNKLATFSVLQKIYSVVKVKYFAYKKVANFFSNNKSELKVLIGKEKTGQNILLATSLGSELVAWRLESILAPALMQRGNHVEFALCNDLLPACAACTYERYKDQVSHASDSFQHICDDCFYEASKPLVEAGFVVNDFSSGLGEQDLMAIKELSSTIAIDEISAFMLGEVDVGEHAMAGALRFFAKASLLREEKGEAILRKYFESALITAYVFRRILVERKINVVVLHHGIYVPQGIIGSVARELGVRVVAWNIAYRKNRFIFSHNDTYHHTLIDEPVCKWEDLAWPAERDQQLTDYLKSRWYGDDDWINFNQENPDPSGKTVIKDLGLDENKPCIAMLTNVLWDAQLHYPANAFANMLEWIFATVEYFAVRPELQLVVRVHPAELSGRIKSRQLVTDEIMKQFPQLPDNIKLIPPAGNISSYDLVSVSNAALIYGTKMGVELSASGVPVIVAGEAWIRGKGVTLDAKTRDDFIGMLNKLPFAAPPHKKIVSRAKRYAYHFFFRRMIPLNVVEESSGWPPFDIGAKTLQDLSPGIDLGLDVICDGIASGSDFIYDENN
ncbi:MAG: hypothetical protein ACI8Y9_000059 [Paracoccaceae bacterium]|jgi:hypothetical protein